MMPAVQSLSPLQSIRRPLAAQVELRGETSRESQPAWLTQAIAIQVHCERGQVKRIAQAVHRAESLVYRWADINGPVAMPAWAVPALCEETGKYTVLDALEQQVGRVAFRIPRVTSVHRDVLEQIAHVTRETADVLTSSSQSLADGELTAEEVTQIEKQIDENIAALAAYRALLRQKVEAQ